MTASAPDARPAPSRGFRWLVLVPVSAAMFANYYVFDALNPVTPLLEKQAGFSQAQIGALETAYNVAALLVLLAGGVFVDRIGTRQAMVIFGGIAALGGLAIALAPGYRAMWAGRFVLGLGSEPFIVTSTTVLGRWFKGKELGFAMAVNLSIARLGSSAADNSASWASGLFGSWRPPLLLAAGVGAGCAAACAAYALLERSAARRFALAGPGATDKLVLADLVRFDRAYWWVVGLCVTFYSAVFPFRRFANLIFIDAHGATTESAGFLNGLLPTAALVATPVFGLLVDRVGRRTLFLGAGALLLVPSFLLLAHTRLPVALPMVLMGVSFSLVPAVLWPAVAYLVEEKRLGSAYALMTFLQQIGWALVPLAVGLSNDRFGASAAHPAGYVPGLWIFASLGLVGLFCAVQLWRAERGPGAHGLETIRAGP